MRIEDLQRALAPIWNALRLLVSRSVVRISNDAPRLQTVQVDLGHADIRSDVERWQDYGVTSRPQDGAEALYLSPGGERSAGAVIAVEDRRYRLQSLEKGEVALYTDEGVAIHLKRGRVVEITGAELKLAATSSVEVTAPTIDLTATGDLGLTAGGSITLSAPSVDVVG